MCRYVSVNDQPGEGSRTKCLGEEQRIMLRNRESSSLRPGQERGRVSGVRRDCSLRHGLRRKVTNKSSVALPSVVGGEAW